MICWNIIKCEIKSYNRISSKNEIFCLYIHNTYIMSAKPERTSISIIIEQAIENIQNLIIKQFHQKLLYRLFPHVFRFVA